MVESPRQAPDNQLKARAIRGSMAILAAQGFQIVLQIASVIILARLLSPADFGIVAMVAPVQALAVLLRQMGFGDAVIQRKDLTLSQASSLFWVQFGICLGLALLMAAAAPAVAWFYGNAVLTAVTIAYSAMIVLGGLSTVQENLLIRRMSFNSVAFARIGAAFLALLIGIVLAYLWRSHWALVVMILSRASIEAALYWIQSRWIPERPRMVDGVGDLLRFGGSVAGARFAHFFSNNAINIMIGKSLGEVSLGLYDRANRLLTYPTSQLHSPLQSVCLPLLSRLQDEPERYRRAFLAILQGLTVVAAPGLLMAVIYAEEMVLLAFGEGWQELVPIFALLAPVTLSQLVNLPLAWTFFTQGRAGEMLGWTWLRAAILFIAVLVGLPHGLLGVVTSYTLTQLFVVTPIIWVWSTRIGAVRLRDVFLALLPYMLAAVPASLALIALRDSLDLPRLVLVLLGTALSYLLMLGCSLALPGGRAALSTLLGMRHHLLSRSGPKEARGETEGAEPRQL